MGLCRDGGRDLLMGDGRGGRRARDAVVGNGSAREGGGPCGIWKVSRASRSVVVVLTMGGTIETARYPAEAIMPLRSLSHD